MTASVPGRRLLDDVRRFGLISAISVAERYAALIDGVGSPAGLAEAGEEVASLLRSLSEAVAPLSQSSHPVDQVRLPGVTAGGRARGSIWLHNRSEEPTAAGQVTVSPFLGPGPSIPVAAQDVPALGPQTDYELEVTVEVPVDQPAGDYHALAVASVAPETPLALSLRVASA